LGAFLSHSVLPLLLFSPGDIIAADRDVELGGVQWISTWEFDFEPKMAAAYLHGKLSGAGDMTGYEVTVTVSVDNLCPRFEVLGAGYDELKKFVW
jgi:hypothetical protein